jgi:hypothetical protein
VTILDTDETLRRFIAAFEAGTFPKEDWSHRAHVIMAAWYWVSDPAHAPERIKSRLLHYIDCQGIVTTNEKGYHETLTLFWIEVVRAAVEPTKGPPLARIRDVAARLGAQSKLHERHWNRDIVRDPVARREWSPPDNPI